MLGFFKQDDGSEMVIKTGETEPFARLLPPKLTGNRKWGIQYRNKTAPHFGGYPNSHPKDRDYAVWELEKVSKF